MKSRSLAKKELRILFTDKYGILWQLMYECALRYSELSCIEYMHLRIENGLIRILSKKRGNDRDIRISKSLQKRLQSLTKNSWKALSKLSCRGLNKRLKRLISNYQGVSTHSLRKTMGTYLYRASKDINLVKTWLGHKSLSSCGYYIDLKYKLSVDDFNLLKYINIDDSKELSSTYVYHIANLVNKFINKLFVNS